MPKHRPDPSDYEMITLSFRVYGAHSKLVHQAAAQKHMSTASYMRKVVCDWAASDLGVEAPDYNALTMGPSRIAEAAKAQGMTVSEFTSRAVREAAAKILDQSEPKSIGTRPVEPKRFGSGAPPAMPTSESGTRKRHG
jgi:uncharacterized protein (DUF1778 family)